MSARTRLVPVLLLIGLLAATCGPPGVREPPADPHSASRRAAPSATTAFSLGQRLEPITPGNASRLEPLAIFEQSTVCDVAFDRAGGRLAANSGDGILIRTSTDGRVLTTLPSGRAQNQHLALSADGSLLAATSLDKVHLWDVVTGELSWRRLDDFEHEVFGVAISPDGSLVAAGTGCVFNVPGSASVRVWDTTTGELRLDIPMSFPVLDVAFSPDGARLAAAVQDQIILLDSATGAVLAELNVPGEVGVSLAFSPDGARLAAGLQELHLWDAGSGERQGSVDRSWDDQIVDLAFTSDGRLLVTGSSTLVFWDVSNVEFRLVQEIELGDANYVNSLALNADNTLLATCEHSEQLRLWGVPASDD